MKSDQRWSFQVERQPRRDAVRRLRKAYQWLWQTGHLESVAIATEKRSEKTTHLGQSGILDQVHIVSFSHPLSRI